MSRPYYLWMDPAIDSLVRWHVCSSDHRQLTREPMSHPDAVVLCERLNLVAAGVLTA